VRSLAVAYDLTGAARYLDACRKWSDRAVALQAQMTPAGAYYMNYARNVPGNQAVASAADQELRHISRLFAQQNPPVLLALRSFAMLSYAEKLCPGALYRKSSERYSARRR
jgi:hypothetical protein